MAYTAYKKCIALHELRHKIIELKNFDKWVRSFPLLPALALAKAGFAALARRARRPNTLPGLPVEIIFYF